MREMKRSALLARCFIQCVMILFTLAQTVSGDAAQVLSVNVGDATGCTYTLYIDGVQQTVTAPLGTTGTYTLASTASLISVDIGADCCCGLLASVTGNVVVSDNTWVCSNKSATGWTNTLQPWPPAVGLEANTDSATNGISSNAKWILANSDGDSYCQKQLTHAAGGGTQAPGQAASQAPAGGGATVHAQSQAPAQGVTQAPAQGVTQAPAQGGTQAPAQGTNIEQWVTSIASFSSQYTATGWSANQIIGQPDVYPSYGDNNKAYAPAKQNSKDYVVLNYNLPVYPSEVDIYETNCAGGVVKVTLTDFDTGANVTVWQTAAPQKIQQSRIFSILLTAANFRTNQIRLDIDGGTNNCWVEIDAVRLNGTNIAHAAGGGTQAPGQAASQAPVHGVTQAPSNGIVTNAPPRAVTTAPPVLATDATSQDISIEQWVTSIASFSSQYTASSWSANQLIGQPDVYPAYGDYGRAYAPSARNQKDYVVLHYNTPVYASGVDIYETNCAGAVVKVTLTNFDTGANVTVWQTAAPQKILSSRIFSVPMTKQTFRTNQVRFDIDGGTNNCWIEIDAVKLKGTYIDINECLTNNGGCDQHATCTNTADSFTCACNAGYAGDGKTCQGTCALTWQSGGIYINKVSGAVSSSTTLVSSIVLVSCLALGDTPNIVPENETSLCVSFMSADQPGYYLRHYNYVFYSESQANPRSSLTFSKDASFIKRTDTFFSGSVTFESVNYPGYYISVQTDFTLRIVVFTNTVAFQNSASFYLNFGGPQDLCKSSPCGPGTCTSNGYIYICTCPDGSTGQSCGVTNPCANNPCGSSAACSAISDNTYSCSCPDGQKSVTACGAGDSCTGKPCGSCTCRVNPGNNLCSCVNDATLPTNCAPHTTCYPTFSSVTLVGPTFGDSTKTWFKFDCTINQPSTDSNARYEVAILFNGVTSPDFPLQTLSGSNQPLSVTVDECNLVGKIGTTLGCSVVSYWSDTTTVRKQAVYSNSYRMYIDVSTTAITVSESDTTAQTLYLYSSLPFTCTDSSTCSLAFNLQTSKDVGVVQNGVTNSQSCQYVAFTSDWNENQQWSVNLTNSLAIYALIDPYRTSPRRSTLTFSTSTLPQKTVNQKTCNNIWSGYSVSTTVQVTRVDSPSGVMTSSAIADVHFTTFDGLFYSSYGSGYFTYCHTTSGPAFEVQARQQSCSGAFVPNDITCVCAVAVGEGDSILILDMCQDNTVRPLGFNQDKLPDGSGVFKEGSWSYRIQMPSGNKVYADVYNTYMNIRVSLVGGTVVEGLMGSPDGDSSNDLKIKGTSNVFPPAPGGWAGPQAPTEVVDSWRPPTGQTLFDGVLAQSDAPADNNRAIASQCSSTGSAINIQYPGDPKDPCPLKKLRQHGKRRKRDTTDDDVDTTYNPNSFDFSPKTTLQNPQWPTTKKGITEQQANDTCTSLIVTEKNLGPACYNLCQTKPELAWNAVRKCMLDVQLTEDYIWADDKIPDLQQACKFEVMTTPIEGSDTDAAILAIFNSVNDVAAFACVPFDCNQQGTCVNGTCVPTESTTTTKAPAGGRVHVPYGTLIEENKRLRNNCGVQRWCWKKYTFKIHILRHLWKLQKAAERVQ